MNHIHTLHQSSHRPALPNQTKIQPGRRYQLASSETAAPTRGEDLSDLDHALQTGMLGAYRLGINSARWDPVDAMTTSGQVFIWEPGLLNPGLSSRIQTDPEWPRSARQNSLTLIDAGLDNPEVRISNGQPRLTISPCLTLEWSTEAFAAQLGLVQLVDSSRTLQFEDGESLMLIDTEAADAGPVLYLDDTTGTAAVKPLCAFQQQGDSRRLTATGEVTQAIPAVLKDKPVASVSVLEKYTWYFMQNADPDDTERHIWVPVHLPVVWGWSIRVQQRFDGVWDIFRKKLIMPAPSTEAPALPSWQSNSLSCRRTLAI